MSKSLMNTDAVRELLHKAAGLDNEAGDPRFKRIIHRLASDACRLIEDFEVTPTEFWTAMSYIAELGRSGEVGLLVPGLGVEHFLDLRMDEEERRAGLGGGTPRTIEGPLYLSDAPLAEGEARLDQDPEQGEALFMEGQVRDTDGRPVPGAIVDVWHANTKGGYSFFDPSQSAWNLRRRIRTDAEGRYRFRSIIPAGYGVPPDGPTAKLLTAIGRHGQRPAHIHFFVEAPGYRKLTTQINLAGDRYLYEDFAFGTRDGLIAEAEHHEDSTEIKERGLNEPFSTIQFDFTLNREESSLPDAVVVREHAKAA